MKKKILFVLSRMNVGGVEKAFLALLDRLPADRYDIDVGLVSHEGGLLDSIPPHVNVFEIKSLNSAMPIFEDRRGALTTALRAGHLAKAASIAWHMAKSRLTDNRAAFLHRFIDASSDRLPRYDVAVAFQGPTETIDHYVAHRVDARRRIGWIHFDIDSYPMSRGTTLAIYRAFDRVAFVSNYARDHFNAKFPELAHKSEVIYNIVDYGRIRRLAEEKTSEAARVDGVLNILTVGRIAHEKGQDVAIRAARILKERGVKFRWLFVGRGEHEDSIENARKKAKEYGLDDCVAFTGSKENPYPYMKACDVYVQPSRHEGYCITVAEARAFGMPVIAGYEGAAEQLGAVPNAIMPARLDAALYADAVASASRLPHSEPAAKDDTEAAARLEELFNTP